jgi:hypothetical protein
MATNSDAGIPSLASQLAISASVDKGMLFVTIFNRSSLPLHHCAIIGSRYQDIERASTLNADRAVAAGLGALFGMAEADNRLNDKVGALEIQTLSMEQGGSIYLPELLSGASAAFPVSSVDGLNFTKSVEVSFWCNEGIAISSRPSNLDKVLAPFAGKPQPGYFFGQSTQRGTQAPSRPSVESKPSRSIPLPNQNKQNRGPGLQPSTGLEPGKGL